MLDIHLLGDFRIIHNGQPLTTISADRQQTLLAYLLLHRHAPQPRQQIAFILWPDSSEAQARGNLRTLLFSLRNALPAAAEYIAADTLTVQWCPAATYTLDVARFTEAVSAAKQATTDTEAQRWWAQAVDLYQGDLLPGNYDDWLIPFREELRHQAIETLQRLAQLLEAAGDYRAALPYATRLLRHDPLHEGYYVGLMRLHALDGDRAGVRRVYEQCVHTLREELDAEPSKATTRAYRELLRLEVATQPMPPTPTPVAASASAVMAYPLEPLRLQPLPTPPTPLLGRESELAAITQLLAEPTCRLLTLTGAGGIGKTRLALAVATEMTPVFPDGVVFAPLAGVQESTSIWSSLARVLQLAPANQVALEQQILPLLMNRRLLLLLDTLEHLLSDLAPVERLLAETTALKILVTSRERLNLREEFVFAVEGLPTASLDPQEANAARALFLQTARRIRSNFAPDASDIQAIDRIGKLVDGLPLGIELAAAWIHLLSPAEIAAEIERNLDFLATPARNVPERHRTLRAVFEHSWQLLSPEEQRLLRHLAVFRGGFTRDLAEVVTDAPLPLLAALSDKSLLRRTNMGRYELHERIRQFAWRKLHEVQEAATISQRHLQACLQLAQRDRPAQSEANQRSITAQLEAEQDNLHAALDWAVDHTAVDGLRLALALERFWSLRGNWRAGCDWYTRLLAALGDQISVEERATALRQLGRWRYILGDLAAATDYFQQSLTLCEQSGNEAGVAEALIGLGDIASGSDQALARYEQALTIQRQLNHHAGIASALYSLASELSSRGHYAESTQRLEESLALLRLGNDHQRIANTLRLIGINTYMRGDFARAQTLYSQSMAIYVELGDKRGITAALNDLGDTALASQQYAQARHYYQEGLRLAVELETKWDIAWNFVGLAQVAHATQEYATATRWFAVAQRLFAEIGQRKRLDDQGEHQQRLTTLRQQLGETHFTTIWHATNLFPLARCVEEALRAE